MDVALEAARAAGAIIRDRFNSEHEVHFKGRSDIVTDVDLAAEKTILDLLTGEFPEFSILAEESKPVDGDSPYKWVVDPLDGTRNYAHGIPHFCTIIALAKDDHIVAGVTYDPVRDEMFTAEEGRGAFLNGAPIRVADAKGIGAGLIAVGANEHGAPHKSATFIGNLVADGGMYIRVGACALALSYVASGRLLAGRREQGLVRGCSVFRSARRPKSVV